MSQSSNVRSYTELIYSVPYTTLFSGAMDTRLQLRVFSSLDSDSYDRKGEVSELVYLPRAALLHVAIIIATCTVICTRL